jgi:hypothetical protein
VQAALTEVPTTVSDEPEDARRAREGGVNESVIDLMVALTYPKKFVVERRGGGSSSTATGIVTGGGWFDPYARADADGERVE